MNDDGVLGDGQDLVEPEGPSLFEQPGPGLFDELDLGGERPVRAGRGAAAKGRTGGSAAGAAAGSDAAPRARRTKARSRRDTPETPALMDSPETPAGELLISADDLSGPTADTSVQMTQLVLGGELASDSESVVEPTAGPVVVTVAEEDQIAEVELEPAAMVEEELVEAEPVVQLEDGPVAPVEVEPTVQLEDDPVALVEVEPTVELEDELVALVEVEPTVRLEDEPVALIEVEPTAQLEDEPAAPVEVESVVLLDAEPVIQKAVAPAVRAEVSEPPLALYRRYRPDVFADIIGQEHVTEPLRRALLNNRVNHAYLFSGPRGCGKTSSARILARALNCEQGPTPDPCGVCDSCVDLARGGPGSIDVIEIDAASHGGVDDARDLRERAFFAPVHSRYKVYIVDEAHMVTSAGFNALLKLVEEPPPHVKFIFATTEPDKVIGTIRSRTHHYPFRLVPPRLLSDYLTRICQQEGVQVEPGVIGLVVRAGAGSVRDALSVLDQLLGAAGPDGVAYAQASALLGYTPDSLLDEFVDALAAGHAHGVFATVDKVIEAGQDPRHFAQDLLRRLRDLIIVGAVDDALTSGLLEVPEDQAERYVTQAKGLGTGELTRAAEVLATGLTAMRGTTAPRLQLELMCARMLLPGADVAGRGLHARLERLERRLAMSSEDSGVVASVGTRAAAPSGSNGAIGTGPASAEAPVGGPVRQPALAAQPPTAAEEWAVPDGASGSHDRPAVGRRPSTGNAPAERPAAGEGPSGAGRPGAGEAPATSVRSTAGEPTAPAGRPEGETPPVGRPESESPAPAGRPESETPTPAGRPEAGETPVGAATPKEPSAARSVPMGAAETPTAMPPSSSPAAPVDRPLSPGALDVTELRRHWPRILDDLKQRRKFVWMTLSQFAQVTDLIGHVLWLTFAEPGARDNFGRSGGEETLRAVIVDLLGANLVIRGRIETDPPPRAEVVTVVSGVGPGGVAPGVDLVPGEAGLEPINAVPAGAGPRVGAADAGPDSTANWASPAAARPSIGPTEAPTHSERAERHLRVVTPAASPATPAPREQSDRGTARRRGEPGVLSSHERVDRDRSLADDSVDEGVAPDDDIIPTEAIGQAAEDLVKEVFRAEFVKAEEGPPRRPGN